jgi:hypothetical protein
MDCRKFHRNLEDYLEGDLDFAGRFGMERHAQQCISCGKELAGAQRLHRMAHDLERVKAPSSFESSVLNEIARRKAHGRFSGLRNFWFYGFSFPSAKKLALASSFLAVAAAGIYFYFPYLSRHTDSSSPPSPKLIATEPASTPLIAQEPAKANQNEKLPVVAATPVAQRNRPSLRQAPGTEELTQPPDPERERIVEEELAETDYVELQLIGPNNLPTTLRLPIKPRAIYGQAAQENFIRNVSH